jgi:endonuclease/exonuclease/phosphatase family metal-dependent hydrolase
VATPCEAAGVARDVKQLGAYLRRKSYIMRIGQKAPAPPAASSANAGANVNVVTFNVAGGAKAFKLEEKLTDAPLFQKLINGDPDAPIVACQETTPALAKKLLEASKNGNFQVIYPGQPNLPKWIPTSTLMQGNMLLVPKRYQVEHAESHTFEGRGAKFLHALDGFLFHHEKANDMLLALQNRGYVEASLKDTRTGKDFNVLATHVAYADDIRRDETPQLVDAIAKAQAHGPTVVMGDFNTPTLEARPSSNPGVIDFWKAMEPLELQDMGPTGKDRGSFWGNGQDIDSVLATGFESVSSEMLTGDKMTLPGHPDAKQVSDHYAEADSLKFE